MAVSRDVIRELIAKLGPRVTDEEHDPPMEHERIHTRPLGPRRTRTTRKPQRREEARE